MGQESTCQSIGHRLREVRGGLSQAEFAEKLGVVSKTIRRYESNETIPDGGFLLKLQEIFNVSPNDILLGKNNVNTNQEGLALLKEFKSALENTIANLENGKE